MKKRASEKETPAKGLTKGLGKGNSNPSNQSKIKAKFESNIGDYKGEIQTFIQSNTNLSKGRAKRKQDSVFELKLFFELVSKIRLSKSQISEKELFAETQKEFIKRKLTLSRTKYFRLKNLLRGRKKMPPPLGKRLTAEQFQAATKNAKPLTNREIEKYILPAIVKKIAQKSEAIKSGRSLGSKKGGEANRKNWENFI